MHLNTEEPKVVIRRERKESPLGLYIAVIKERPAASEGAHKAALKRLILQDGYDDFLEALIEEWLSIKYSTALRAAAPPSVNEIKHRAVKRREERQKLSAATESAKALIGARLLELIMPNGKPLSECTGAECVKFGGWYTKIGERVGPRRVVGKVLNADTITAILAS
jgi:hypothetical protein